MSQVCVQIYQSVVVAPRFKVSIHSVEVRIDLELEAVA